MRVMRFTRMLATIVVLCGLHATAHAGAYTFDTPRAAGAPGGAMWPTVSIRFAGDGETIDAQVDYFFDGSRFTATTVSRNGALCTILNGDQLRVISPSSGGPLSTNTIEWCRVTFSAKPGTAAGTYGLTINEGDPQCYGAIDVVSPCTAPDGAGLLIVGPNAPAPSIAFDAAPSSTITLTDGANAIHGMYVPGGTGGTIGVDNCTLAPTGNFAAPALTPAPARFISTFAGDLMIAMTCTLGQAQTTATLSCDQTLNGVATVPLTWNVVCPALPSPLYFFDDFESPL